MRAWTVGSSKCFEHTRCLLARPYDTPVQWLESVGTSRGAHFESHESGLAMEMCCGSTINVRIQGASG